MDIFWSRCCLGITALLALGILEQIQVLGKIKSLLELEHNSAEYLHALIEVMRSVHLLSCYISCLIPFLSGSDLRSPVGPRIQHLDILE